MSLGKSGAAGFGRQTATAGDSEHPANAGDDVPMVSIIMIFFNEVEFIEEAIASVRAQLLQDWELLLVDDGSNDGSSEIGRAHAARHPLRIRYLTHPGAVNRGTGPSRQLGLSVARGRYLAFLDADDVYLPERLSAHVQVLERRSDVDVVQSYHLNWHSWKPVTQRQENDHLQGPVFPGESLFKAPAAMINSLTNVDSAVGMGTITIRREAALRHGGFEVQFRSLFEDQAFLTKLYLHSTVYLLPDCLALYRMHPHSTVGSAFAVAHQKGGQYQQASRALADWQMQFVSAGSTGDPVIRNMILGRVYGARAQGLRWNGLRLLGVGLLRRLLSWILPAHLFSLLRRRRLRRIHRRVMADYLAICDDRARAEAGLLEGFR